MKFCSSATTASPSLLLLLLLLLGVCLDVTSGRERDRDSLGGKIRDKMKEADRQASGNIEWLVPESEDLAVDWEDREPVQGSGGSPPTSSTTVSRRIMVPHCDPGHSSYNPSQDAEGGCQVYTHLCSRRHGAYDKWEYDAAELMLTKCFRTCVEEVGLETFCSLTEPPPNPKPAMPFCSQEQQQELWSTNGPKTQNENEMLHLLNVWRSEGITCPGNERFDPVPPAIRNPQLDCAARAQARKIVMYANKHDGFGFGSPSLHDVCDPARNNCDHFSDRMEKAGYDDWMGVIQEVASFNYFSPLQGLEAWLGSTSGHCPVLMQQHWHHIQTEVGIGYFHDPNTGRAAYVMVAGQQ